MSTRTGGVVLELDDVVKHHQGYGGEVIRAVDGVTLTIGAGELVALHGPSGSGKSTLLLLAAALMAPDAGVVRFEGQDLAALSAREAADYQRREIGFIYQSFHLMAGVPATENAAIKLLADRVPLSEARRVANVWLERVGLAGRLQHTPDRLSGGERQRVAIARALVNEPRLILADEPTGSLDTQRGGEILALLAQISRRHRVAVLLVTHDAQAAAIADRVCTLRDGRLHDDERPPAPATVTGSPATLPVAKLRQRWASGE
ncbi:MAG TPA: ABC transporter ATP-binding protein [Solirubrobacteraceae bacterium]|nr:ABC transporter ATP-binding protein [Solirubrobacteraceae bacterium]